MMKKLTHITTFILTFVLLFTISLTVVNAEEKPSGMVYGKIVTIHDGNSFTILTIDNELYKFKISGIDTSKNPDAYNLMQGFLKGKNVKILIHNTPSTNLKAYSYGVVYISNEDIAKQILTLGYASVDTTTCTSSNLNFYNAYQNVAKKAKVGIWNDIN